MISTSVADNSSVVLEADATATLVAQVYRCRCKEADVEADMDVDSDVHIDVLVDGNRVVDIIGG